MNIKIQTASQRGTTDIGWLKSFHSFSFGSYYDPDKMSFGALRVVNDDKVAGGGGFPMHEHKNMEIVSIPLKGELLHKDSMGNSSIIKTSEIQIMSAGTGVFHSEFNNNNEKDVEFLQIWISPRELNLTPSYSQKTIQENKEGLIQICSPEIENEGVVIHQDAWVFLWKTDSGGQIDYQLQKEGNGVYLFVIEGTIEINGKELKKRDSAEITDIDTVLIASGSGARLLIIEVPIEHQ